ncbi:MAG: CPBP family intramembrane glutamic endopeptidase [Chthonomonadales bacterium]
MNNQPRRPLLLLLAAGSALLVGAAVWVARPAPKQTQSSDRLALDTLVECRSAYLALRFHTPTKGDGFRRISSKVLDDLYTVALATRSPGAVRRLVLMRYTLGDASWQRDLALLWHTPEAMSPFRVEQELALWHDVLASHPVPARHVADLAERVRQLNLGWFEHLALSALYRNASMPLQAAKEEEAALGSALVLQTCLSFLALAAVLGTALGVAAVTAILRRRRPWWLTPVPAEPVSVHQSHVLKAIFGSYVAAYLLLEIVLSQIGRPISQAQPVVRVAASLLLTVIWALVPYDVYRSWGRVAGITPSFIGWRTRNLFADVLFGVCGYMVALPLVALATVVSSWVFRAFESPVHPALMEFAGSRSAWVHVLLFIQAGCVAPLFEETLFRGVLYKALVGRIGIAPAVLLASAVFALLHPQLPIGFLGIFILGCVFHGLAILRGSLVPAVVAHALNNSMILLLFALILGS